jgi:GMP synthase-like glutamine amidotransferase
MFNCAYYILTKFVWFSFQVVWMIYGDEALKMQNEFEVVVESEQGVLAAMECLGRRFYRIQYHSQV